MRLFLLCLLMFDLSIILFLYAIFVAPIMADELWASWMDRYIRRTRGIHFL